MLKTKQKKVRLPLVKGIHTGLLSEIRVPGGVDSVRTGGSTGQSFPCTSLVIRSFNPEGLMALGVHAFFLWVVEPLASTEIRVTPS